jgi:hypothetical protein
VSTAVPRAAVALLLQLACATSATIQRRDAGTVDAWIVGSDENGLLVRDARGQPTRIPRDEIADVDHPGNVLVMAGLGLLAVGAQIVLSDQERGEELAMTSTAVGLPALAMIGWGGRAYLASKGAAARCERETRRLTIPDPNRPYLPAPIWSAPVLPPTQ